MAGSNAGQGEWRGDPDYWYKKGRDEAAREHEARIAELEAENEKLRRAAANHYVMWEGISLRPGPIAYGQPVQQQDGG